MTAGALYAAFAGLAIAVNLLVQQVVFLQVAPDALFIAMPLGALAGLGVKYHLDRRYIFRPETPASQAEFFGYAATGGGLTALFFLFEAGFWALTSSAVWRDLGAVTGLLAGYVCKFHLDRRLVFTSRSGRRDLDPEGMHEHA